MAVCGLFQMYFSYGECYFSHFWFCYVFQNGYWSENYRFLTFFSKEFITTKWLLMLSHFSRVGLCVTPKTEAHQAPPSLRFSRQEHWSGLPFPSPMHESEKWKWSCSVVSDPQRPHGLQPSRLLHPWDFPGRSTGVGCHCFLQLNE